MNFVNFFWKNLYPTTYEKPEAVAKIVNPIIPLSGTVGGVTHVHSLEYGDHTRAAQTPGLRKDEPAIKSNYTRTEILNSIAAPINQVITKDTDGHYHRGFYFEMQRRLRSQPNNNRYLLLNTLIGVNVHSHYTLDSVGGIEKLTVNPGKRRFNLEIDVKYHPGKRDKTDCYRYEFLLMTWTEDGLRPNYEQRFTPWISFSDARPEFETSFKRTEDIVHWLLFMKKEMGLNKEPGSLKFQGMRIIQAGTFIKEEKALLKKYIDDQKKKKPLPQKKQDETILMKRKKPS